MSIIKKLLVYFFFFLIGTPLNAQLSNFRFDELSISDGLSQNTVTALLQDKDGFIWVGTADGFNRFDGYSFKTFNKINTNPNSLSYNHITCLYQDTEGFIWIGTLWGGVNKFDPFTENFEHFLINKEEKEFRYSIRGICEDEESNIFMATNQGLAIISREDYALKMCRYNFRNLRDPENNLNDILRDSYGDIFVSTKKNIYQYDFKSQKYFPFFSVPDNNAVVPETITCIKELDSQHMFIGTSKGYIILDKQSKSFTHSGIFPTAKNIPDVTEVRDMTIENNHSIWLATGHGLVKYNMKNKKYTVFKTSTTLENSISQENIICLEIDNAGVLWVGLNTKGINKVNLNKKEIDHILFPKKNKDANDISGVYIDKKGNYWLGGKNNGIMIVEPNGNLISHIYPGSVLSRKGEVNILGFIEDSRQNLWLLTGGHGIIRVQNKINNINHYQSLGFTFYKPDLPYSKNCRFWAIRDAHEDKNGDIWLASTDGLFKMNIVDTTFTQELQLDFESFEYLFDNYRDYNTNTIWAVTTDQQENTWIGSGDDGLFRLYKENGKYQITHYENFSESKSGISSDKVRALYCDEQNNIWIGTEGGGLNLYDRKTNTFKVFTKNDGLSNNAIVGICKDLNNSLWLSSFSGVTKFSTTDYSTLTFDKRDGLQDNFFNFASIYISEQGKIIMGGPKGVNIFHPDSLKATKFLPKVVITKIKINEESISVNSKNRKNERYLKTVVPYAKKINLRKSENSVVFEFSSLHFSSPEKIKYKYVLEGYKSPVDKWTLTSADMRRATFTNLEPGNYTFKVKATNCEGKWNPVPAEIKIHISPPFFKSIWFILIALCFISGFIYAYLRIREKRLNLDKKFLESVIKDRTKEITRKNKELESYKDDLEEIIKKRTKDLVLAKEKAETADKLKTAFLSNMSHEIRTPLNSIVGFSNLLSDEQATKEERKQYIQYINNSSSALQQIINDIIDLARIESDQLQLNAMACNINEVIEDLIRMFKGRISKQQKKNISIKYIPNQEVETLILVTDPLRFKQILMNLIDNGLKFTKKGSVEVKYIIDKKDNEVIFSVKDTGIGIPVEKHDQIFNRFSKLEHVDQKYEGTGLGLAISKNLVEKLDGKIWVESLLGKGSNFKFSLPLKTVYEEETKPKKKKERKYDFDHFKGKTILIVEDEDNNFQFIYETISRTPANKIRVHNGQEAIDFMSQPNNIDLILMDLQLPKLDGFEATRKIKKMNKKVPIIAQTAYAMPGDKEKSINAGCIDYIAKPYKALELLMKIGNYLPID